MSVDILLSQIQPHFLYNTLGTISHLCRRDPAEAQKAIQEFSAFLRANMDSLKKRTAIPFEQELNHVMNYLRLEQRRFQSRLKVIYEIQASDFRVPPLSLQPLVENSVRHGILKKEDGGMVAIRTRETEDAFLVMIEDDGVGMEKAGELPDLGEHTHMGIENVRSRLRSMAGGTMEIESGDWGTRSTLSMPKIGGERQAVSGSR